MSHDIASLRRINARLATAGIKKISGLIGDILLWESPSAKKTLRRNIPAVTIRFAKFENTFTLTTG